MARERGHLAAARYFYKRSKEQEEVKAEKPPARTMPIEYQNLLRAIAKESGK